MGCKDKDKRRVSQEKKDGLACLRIIRNFAAGKGMMMKRVIFLTVLLIFTDTIMAQQQGGLRIAFSKTGMDEKYRLYADWISSVFPEAEIVDMAGLKPADAAKELKSCHGLVLTGGPDVYPGLYGREKDLDRCGKVDRVRDSQEIMLLKTALEMKMPILAICRGAQLVNVFHGGSLIIDIPTDVGSLVPHKLETSEGAWHEILIEPKSRLFSIIQTKTGRVNSFHHQAVDRLAGVFVAEAKSKDGIIEAYGWKEPAGKSFLLAVQWHPERMTDDPLFSRALALEFTGEVKKFRGKRR